MKQFWINVWIEKSTKSRGFKIASASLFSISELEFEGDIALP